MLCLYLVAVSPVLSKRNNKKALEGRVVTAGPGVYAPVANGLSKPLKLQSQPYAVRGQRLKHV